MKSLNFKITALSAFLLVLFTLTMVGNAWHFHELEEPTHQCEVCLLKVKTKGEDLSAAWALPLPHQISTVLSPQSEGHFSLLPNTYLGARGPPRSSASFS